jgi:hypothetical protein
MTDCSLRNMGFWTLGMVWVLREIPVILLHTSFYLTSIIGTKQPYEYLGIQYLSHEIEKYNRTDHLPHSLFYFIFFFSTN